MNTNITISLDTRRAKKDGTYPLVLRLGHNGKTTSIPTNVSLKETDWNDKDKKIRSTYKGVTSIAYLNNKVQKQRSDAMDIILRLHDDEKLKIMSITDLKERLTDGERVEHRLSFFDFGEEQVKAERSANKFGNARTYEFTLDVLDAFINGQNRYRDKKPDGRASKTNSQNNAVQEPRKKGKNLFFDQIDYSFLVRWENHHLGKGGGYNSLSVYMRTLRAIFNKAIKAKLIDKEIYPFNDYTIKETETRKRALVWDQFKKIIELDLPPEHTLFNTRNYFVASFYMWGMNFIDMANLQKTMVVEGRIQYRRQKSKKIYDIKIIEQLQTIIDYYAKRNPDSQYLFPIHKSDNLAQQHWDIQWSRNTHNDKLKELAKLVGIEQNLTSYVSRHSFATRAKFLNVPNAAIQDMLGHSNARTTEIYLDTLPTDALDDYNSQIVES